MADNTILIPGEEGCKQEQTVLSNEAYLQIDNYLSEWAEEFEKEIARNNLNVWSKDEVYTRTETDLKIQEEDKATMNYHLAQDDPHGILPKVDEKLRGTMKNDGSTPFIAPQVGVDPVSDLHLTTKRFVSNLLAGHMAKVDPHNVMELVRAELKAYVLLTQVYGKNEVYTRGQTDALIKDLVNRNGTTAFTRPQLGVDPLADAHLTTKRYVDNLLREHIIDVDPHGLITTINQRLSNYYRKSETYSKAETYSRPQIDTIINSLVMNAAREAIEEHVNSYDPHHVLREIDNRHYVSNDGSVPFVAPQAGVDGVNNDHLVTKRQLDQKVDNIEFPEATWITSGPVQTTVGFVEDNTDVPVKLTFQEAMDAIFYGKGVDVKSPAYGILNETVQVDMFIHGSLGLVETIELWQNDVLVSTFNKDQFENGQYSVNSLPITEDATFTFKVYYSNGVIAEATSTTKVGYSMFVGILPKWYTASNITWEYLQNLIKEDPTNNKIDDSGDSVKEIKMKYDFSSPKEPKHLFLAIPKEYPKLVQMTTPSQQFGPDAFDIINDIPLNIPGMTQSKIYTLYVYREALIALSTEVTYKFE